MIIATEMCEWCAESRNVRSSVTNRAFHWGMQVAPSIPMQADCECVREWGEVDNGHRLPLYLGVKTSISDPVLTRLLLSQFRLPKVLKKPKFVGPALPAVRNPPVRQFAVVHSIP